MQAGSDPPTSAFIFTFPQASPFTGEHVMDLRTRLAVLSTATAEHTFCQRDVGRFASRPAMQLH